MSDAQDWLAVATSYDHADAQLERARAEMERGVAELRADWSAGVARAEAAAEARDRQRQEAELARLAARAGGESAPAQDVAGAGDHGAAASGPQAAPHVGHGPRPPQPPTQQEMAAMAAAVKAMDLSDFGRLRAELGIGNSAGTRGLFSQ